MKQPHYQLQDPHITKIEAKKIPEKALGKLTCTVAFISSQLNVRAFKPFVKRIRCNGGRLTFIYAIDTYYTMVDKVWLC